MNLTPKQLRVLRYISDTRLAKGYSPTMQEIGSFLNVSKITAFEHVEALIRKGAVLREERKRRSLSVNPDVQLPSEEVTTRLPLVGTIAAGSPIEAVETDEYLDLGNMFLPTKRSATNSKRFALIVRGESMIEDKICDGDYVVCEQRQTARNGETVVALLDTGEATLKRYYKQKSGKIKLQPANKDFKPLFVESAQLAVQGVVIGVVRSY